VKALDRRLALHARATRSFLRISVALGGLGALLIVAQAWLLADVVASAFLGGSGLAQLRTQLVLLLAIVVARATVAWAAELAAGRCSARAKSQLRGALLDRVSALGFDGSADERTGKLAILASRGIDALDGYFSLYLPQVFLALIVPLVLLAVLVWADWISAAIIAATIPLIPLFMALVGASTRERMQGQLRALESLAGHFLDVVAGLPTLKIFGRAKAQARVIGEVTDRYRRTAISTLRVSFLSSLVLELLATISVALVAVAIGLRLMNGQLGLRTGLFVLVLAPEAYLPLRQLGANYHASAEGLAAAQEVFEVLERPRPPLGTRTNFPDPVLADITVEGLRVSYAGRPEPALDGVSLTIEAGEVLAVVGPSGCGKSTLLGVLLGLVTPELGSVRVGGVDLNDLDPDAWRAKIAWVPQRPHLFCSSIAQNVRLGRREASMQNVWEALSAAGLAEVIAQLPSGLETMLGDQGSGLSAGERQRLALARAFLRDSPLLLLDEPTANLDGETEQDVLRAVRRLSRGRTVLLVAHRPALLEVADRVLALPMLEVAA
jgi:thiol reductant ABC exporter CydD subunit